MNSTKLVIGSHNHTPFGSCDEDFERQYRLRYKPFLATLYRFPSVPATIHYSGVLLSWLEQKHPEFLMILQEMVDRKQVELLGGGYYEPMMPLIPLSDRIGQIELLTTFLRKRFGKRPRGCWLPGLMWEQNLAGSLQTCGMDYIFLGEEQFRSAGLMGGAAERLALTEDQGKLITVFPVAVRLGSSLETADPREFVHSVSRGAEDGAERIITVFPERFASDSGDAQATEARIQALFEALSFADSRLELTTPARILKSPRSVRKACFPSSAEPRVMYWAMDEERRKGYETLSALESKGALDGAGSFFYGAFPRQFLVRYGEANGLYSKMIFTHILINQLRGDKYRKRAAREELWKAQGCDAFWHIGDGGLHGNGLRKAAYRSLIEAEKIAREKGVFCPSVSPVDFDLDGEREYLFQGAELNCYVRTEGGSVFELDYLAKPWNYLDTFARRREAYAEGEIVVDAYRRSAFVDRLLAPDTGVSAMAALKASGGRCCALERYEELELDRQHQQLTLRNAPVTEGPFASIEIVKKFLLRKNTLTVSYALCNRGSKPERFNFATEIDLSFAGEEPALQRLSYLRSSAEAEAPLEVSELRGIDEVFVEDGQNGLTVALGSSSSFDLWVIPIRVLGRIGGAVRERYQSTCLMPVRPVILASGESWETRYILKFGK